MRQSADPFEGSGFYPERGISHEPAMDRLAASLGFRLQRATSRSLRGQSRLVSKAERHAAQLGPGALAGQVPTLRYRLRRDGWRADNAAECLGLCWAALAGNRSESAAAQILGAADALVKGAIVDLADAELRAQALALAAMARAVAGVPVHVLSASDARAGRLAERLRAPLEALGLKVECIAQGMEAPARRNAYGAAVVCGAQREIGFDYLRDRVRIGSRPRALHGLLERLSGDALPGQQLLLRGLHCALVEDADLVMLDDAHAPLVISAEADVSSERLLYDQALELALALVEEADFTLSEEGVSIFPRGSQRLAQLSVLLGSVWARPQRREELVRAALEALHLRKRERDYQVQQDRVLFPKVEHGGGEPAPDESLVRNMVEIKEGCALSRRRDVLYRISVPRFLTRYLHVAGVCESARGLETEFWTLYGLKTRRAGPPKELPRCAPRVFRTTAARREAVLLSVRARVAEGQSVVAAVRSPSEAQALQAMFSQAGVACEITLHPAQREAKAMPPGSVTSRSGSLHLVVAELHDARRHVAQIYGALGADSCEICIALEDKSVASRIGPLAILLASLGNGNADELGAWRTPWLSHLAQGGAERALAAERREMVMRERQLDDLLAFSGQQD